MFFGKDFLSRALQVSNRQSVYMTHDVAQVAHLSCVQIVFGKVERKLLTIIAGYGQLSLQLLLGPL